MTAKAQSQRHYIVQNQVPNRICGNAGERCIYHLATGLIDEEICELVEMEKIAVFGFAGNQKNPPTG